MSTNDKIHNNPDLNNYCHKPFINRLLDLGSEVQLDSSQEGNDGESPDTETIARNRSRAQIIQILNFDIQHFPTRITKAVQQKKSSCWPCVVLVVSLFFDCTLEVSKFIKLSEEQQEIIFKYLELILTKGSLNQIKNFISHPSLESRNSIKLEASDFLVKKNRTDEALKIITSQALKKLYRDFMKVRHINKNLNPKTFVPRKEINRRIYLHYFEREPTGDEHNKLFAIKKGVNKEWFSIATGGATPRTEFIIELLKIIEGCDFFDFYKQKIDSMVKRFLGVVDFAEAADSIVAKSDETKKVLSKLQHNLGVQRPKLPCNKYLFYSCVKKTIDKLLENAEFRNLKIKQTTR